MIERPMHQLLLRTSRRRSLHMPASQGRAPFGRVDPYRLETTELPCTDDLYHPTGAIARAEALAAQSANAVGTLMLHGGGTAGVQTMLFYAASRGDTVILPRTAHLSAVNACALAGLEPAFARASIGKTGRAYVSAASYAAAMDAHPNAKAVLVTRPDYYGTLGELDEVARLAHERHMLVLCDEAHGACFNWDAQATNAGACGADLFVQSAHKTLPALNAGAWLHAMAGVDMDRLRRTLRLAQTSSPSFVGMMALDDARAWMDVHGADVCAALREALADFRLKAARLGFTDGQDEAGMRYDPLRLVLNAPMGGYELARRLALRSLDVEMADDARIVCILSLMDGRKRLRALLKALGEIARESVSAPPRAPQVSPPAELPPRALSLGAATFAPSCRVPIGQAVGRVSAAQVGLYPPGVALLTAGERVTRELADYLQTLDPVTLFGAGEDGTLFCIREEEASL